MSETGRLLLGTMPRPEGGGAGRAFRKTLPGGAFETRLGFLPGTLTRIFSKAPQWHFVTPQDNRSLMSGWSGVALLGHGWQHVCFGCLGIHTYLPTYIHAYVHAYILAYIHAYKQKTMHAYIHTRRHTYIHTGKHTYIHTDGQTNKHTNIHTDRQTYIHTDILTDIHTYRHT